jgi:hydroxymethylbilane synthase
VTTIRIATRSSELALFQARQVQQALAARGVTSELATYKTVGDRRLDQPLSAIGAKGLFTKELEDDLAAGRVHCCVHSLKDLPTEMPDGLELVALLPREDPRDVLIVNRTLAVRSIAQLPAGARVGTSSLRRRAQLTALRPDLVIVDLRGNVPTRVRKIDDGAADAAILAAAGLHRLGLADRIDEYLDPPAWLSAAGQGAIAIQIRREDAAMRALFAPLADRHTMTDVEAERAFLASLEGGCQVPIGAAVVRAAGVATLHGFIASVDGARVVRGERTLDEQAPASTGEALGSMVRSRGGDAIIGELRANGSVPSPQPE